MRLVVFNTKEKNEHALLEKIFPSLRSFFLHYNTASLED